MKSHTVITEHGKGWCYETDTESLDQRIPLERCLKDLFEAFESYVRLVELHIVFEFMNRTEKGCIFPSESSLSRWDAFWLVVDDVPEGIDIQSKDTDCEIVTVEEITAGTLMEAINYFYLKIDTGSQSCVPYVETINFKGCMFKTPLHVSEVKNNEIQGVNDRGSIAFYSAEVIGDDVWVKGPCRVGEVAPLRDASFCFNDMSFLFVLPLEFEQEKDSGSAFARRVEQVLLGKGWQQSY
jgi:hypothetical protein